ncbi:hypothetical protein ACO2Q8_13105 [Larkinella sp. VNQ87]|uniref:hypothetical protein n=1 Tax=Larkinella sp. VNQ87 TaxID=3400921 RepID=UPI003BFE4C94
MNHLTKLSALALGTLLLTSSCENQQLTPSAPFGSSADQSTQSGSLLFDDVTVTLAKKYTLVKDGNATLVYNSDGTLQKVMEGNRVTTYGYSPGKITTLTLVDGIKTEDGTYHLDASGRCTKAELRAYSKLENGIPLTTLYYYYYQYDAKGRLTKRYGQIDPDSRTEFTYNADNNLVETKKYDHANNLLQKNTYEYQTVRGGSLIADKYRLNPMGIENMDPYLRIFGKTSKNLVLRLITTQPVYGGINSDYRFSYSLNEDGYVTTRKKYANTSGFLLETKPYDYLVSNPIINP